MKVSVKLKNTGKETNKFWIKLHLVHFDDFLEEDFLVFVFFGEVFGFLPLIGDFLVEERLVRDFVVFFFDGDFERDFDLLFVDFLEGDLDRGDFEREGDLDRAGDFDREGDLDRAGDFDREGDDDLDFFAGDFERVFERDFLVPDPELASL